MQIYGARFTLRMFGLKNEGQNRFLLQTTYFCTVKQEEIIQGFVQLGRLMTSVGENHDWEGFSSGVTKDEYEALQTLVDRQIAFNGWFIAENVRQSLTALGSMLTEEKLTNWTKDYGYSTSPKSVALIMAGNIPLVGFHDFLCVLISGNTAVCKLSSDDKTLLPALVEHLITFVPALKERIVLTTGRIEQMEAVIATGSDNSLKYFEQYFGKYPHIFRGNRTSLAVLTGEETKEEIERLGTDIFSYFGLGCRNVSHVLFPKEFEISRFFEGIFPFSNVINNNKYGNNYDYNKAVYLMNRVDLLDNNFVLIRETEELFSPLAMVNYHFYETQDEVNEYISLHQEKIQVVVGKEYTPFGKAQSPELDDYADGVDTMKWLSEL